MGSSEREEKTRLLTDEIERLLAAALQSDADHEAATNTAQLDHDTEIYAALSRFRHRRDKRAGQA